MVSKSGLIASSIFLLSVIILVGNYFIINPSSDTTIEFLKITLLAVSLVYVLVYISHIIIIQKYELLKKHFYEQRIDDIREMLKPNDGWKDELFNVVYLSAITNLAILYFLSLTSPEQILSRIPGFEGVDIVGTEFTKKLFSFETFTTITRLDFFLPFTILGTVVVFSLRFIHRKKLDEKDDGVPGSNALLAFLYAMIGIAITQITLAIFGIFDSLRTINDLIVLMILVFLFSIFGVPATILASAVDRFLLSKIKS